jgi:hypothetical protein
MNDNGVPPSMTLAGQTLITMRAFFDARRHHPSEEQWEALADIATIMESMADGDCPPQVFLSSVDPGVGKSTAIIHFAKALTESARYPDVGMVVAVGRVNEAESLAEALTSLGVPASRFAVLTAPNIAAMKEANAVKPVNVLGNHDAGAAQVLIVTKQRLERNCERTDYADVKAFYFQGKPRAVRIYDEEWLPGCTVTTTCDDLLSLVAPLRSRSHALAGALKWFALSLDDYGDGDTVDVPDFEALHDVSLWSFAEAFGMRGGRFTERQQAVAIALRNLCGRRVTVCTDGTYGNTALTYRDTLPDDLVPLLVLDASGRVRQIYRDMEEHRGTLVRLKDATKDYSPLTVHVWRTSGGKDAFREGGDRLIAGIAETILTKPNEDWLVVAHQKAGKIPDVAARLARATAGQTTGKVQTITWGNHVSTNLYSDFANVVLAGTLFLRPSDYRAMTHMGHGLDPAVGRVTSEAVRRTERGEHRHMVLQALCRGRVRRSDGPRCLTMNAYIIASNHSGIPNDLQEVFPRCTIREWNAGKRELTGNPAKAMKFIEAALKTAEWVS